MRRETENAVAAETQPPTRKTGADGLALLLFKLFVAVLTIGWAALLFGAVVWALRVW